MHPLEKFAHPLREEAAWPLALKRAIRVDSNALCRRTVPSTIDIDHRDFSGLDFSLAHKAPQSKDQVFAVRLDNELMSVSPDTVNKQIANLSLKSGVNMYFGLFDGDDVVACGNTLDDDRKHLADAETDIGERDIQPAPATSIPKPHLVDIRAPPKRSEFDAVVDAESLEPVIGSLERAGIHSKHVRDEFALPPNAARVDSCVRVQPRRRLSKRANWRESRQHLSPSVLISRYLLIWAECYRLGQFTPGLLPVNATKGGS